MGSLNPKTAGAAGVKRLLNRFPSYWPLLVILIAGATVRFVDIGGKSLWYDELYGIWASRLPLNSVPAEAAASGHPPLYYLLGHVWFGLGSGDVWVRLLSWAAGVAVIWLVYLVGKELFSRRTGLWAAALSAVSPLLIWYSREATSYSLVVALSLLSFLFLIRSAREGGWKNWIVYSLVTIVAMLTYYFAAVLIVANAAVFWFLRRKSGQTASYIASHGILSVVAVAATWVAKAESTQGWLILHRPGFTDLLKGVGKAWFVVMVGWAGNDVTVGAGAMGLSTRRIWALELSLAVALMVLLAAAGRFRRRVFSRNSLAVFVYTLILLVLPVMLLAVSSRNPAARFIVWAAPFFALLLAAAIDAAPRKTGAVAGAAMIALMAFFTVWELHYLQYRDGDWRQVMATISQIRQPQDRMLCFPLHQCEVAASFYLSQPMAMSGGIPSFDIDVIYFPPGDVWTGYRSGYFAGSGAQPPLSGAVMEKKIESDVAGAGRIWVVDEDETYGGYPASKNIYDTLSKNWVQVGQWSFPPQVVKLYTPRIAAGGAAT